MSRSVFADFTRHLEPGEVLYSTGEAGTTMFVVQSGTVEVVRETAAGPNVTAIMEKGDFFGEMSLLEGGPRAATARTTEPTVVIEISPALFDRMIRSNIEIAVRMLRKLSIRLSAANQRLELAPDASIAATPEAASPAEPAQKAASALRREQRMAGDTTVERPPRTTPRETARDTGRSPESADEKCHAFLVQPDGHKVFTLAAGTVRVGRFDPVTGTRPEVDLTLLDLKRSVSRRHAVLTLDDGGCLLTEEVGALNGTSLNGNELTPGEAVNVRDGDEIAFGSVTLRFQGATR